MELNVFEKARKAYEEFQFKNVNEKIIYDFYNLLSENKNEIEKICNIEKNYCNLYKTIENVLNKPESLRNITNVIEERKREDGFIIGKYKVSIGVIGVIFNGDPYVTVELAKKAITTKNAVVFCTNDKLYAITNLLAIYFGKALELNDCPKDIIQVINDKDYEEIFKHNNIIDKIIVVGNRNLQTKVIAKSRVEVITSGYNCFDMYIEDIMDVELIKKILSTENIELNVYVNTNISKEKIEELGIEEYTEVESVEECIRDININSGKYSSSIFTKKGENANKFLKLVKSRNVFVNASPTAERSLDIGKGKFVYTKQVLFSNH